MRIPYRKPGKYSQIPTDPLLTQTKVEELKRKLNRLKNIRPQAISEVTRLAQLGDFSENAEYQLAKGRLRGINNAILSLEQQLNRAIIIDEQGQKETVQLGHTVTIKNDHIEKSYRLLGSSEADPKKGIISHNSPLGASLIGHKVGEKITVKLADREMTYVILKIE